ncbi:MAG TPA: GspMb/PilO family protein [Candidatus Binatia bacterium]|nr:GspMb/PilO family protein [Candidatus Binatia bacterium]
MRIENRQQALAVVAVVAVTLLVGDKLVVTPLVSRWKERGARISELTKAVNQGSLVLAREQAIRNRWDNMRTNTLPENVSAAENELLKAFERWSQASRISIASIKPQWKRTSDDYVTLECRADAFGSIQALTRFLYDVEQDPLALKVEAVEITTRDNDGQQLSLGLQVSGLQLNAQQP